MALVQPSARRGLILVGIIVLAFNLRPAAVSIGPVLDDLVAELTALRDELDAPEALRARLTQVAEDGTLVRRPAPEFTPCAALDEALGAARAAGTPLVVRRRAGDLEVAAP